MYKPEILAERLGVPLDVVDLALEETGYYKAVQIREDLIKLKTRLKDDSRRCTENMERLSRELKWYRDTKISVDHHLEDVRDILRRPREKQQLQDDYNRDMNSVIDQAGKETRCGTTSEK